MSDGVFMCLDVKKVASDGVFISLDVEKVVIDGVFMCLDVKKVVSGEFFGMSPRSLCRLAW